MTTGPAPWCTALARTHHQSGRGQLPPSLRGQGAHLALAGAVAEQCATFAVADDSYWDPDGDAAEIIDRLVAGAEPRG